MTPSARLSAAIEILDLILAGGAVEPCLTTWGRTHRFAGSGDRHAIRDLVFEALRRKRSFAALGGSMTGRGLILGLVRATGQNATTLFTGLDHAPSPPSPAEAGHTPKGAEALDIPDWLEPNLNAALGPDFEATLQAMQHRAPVFLRVNLARTTLEAAQRSLASDGIASQPHPLADTALQVTSNDRKVHLSSAYLEGLVELQDVSSQAVVACIDLPTGARVLDYCAGGGGKTLALAARGVVPVAHDVSPARMKDLPTRADRARVEVSIVQDPAISAPYDVILADAPCSGSGSWRRDPNGKWALTAERLDALVDLQAQILDHCTTLLAANGTLAYATCSLLNEENERQVAAFLVRNPKFRLAAQHRFGPLLGGDGFFVAMLTCSKPPLTQL